MTGFDTDGRGFGRRTLLRGIVLAVGGALVSLEGAQAAGGLAGIAARYRVTVVNFWATWCAGCVSEMPALNAVYRQIRGRGVGFVGVNDKEDQATVSAFVRKRGVSYPVLLDPSGAILDAYGVRELPTTLILDLSGAARVRFSGETTSASLKAKIDAVMRAA